MPSQTDANDFDDESDDDAEEQLEGDSESEENEEDSDDEDDERVVDFDGPVDEDGLPHGTCKLQLKDGRTREGEFCHGEEHGYVREYYRSDEGEGAGVEMVSEGRYENGQRVGRFLFYFAGGGVLEGLVDPETELITDDRAIWWYQGLSDTCAHRLDDTSDVSSFKPVRRTRLVGKWKDGELVEAIFADGEQDGEQDESRGSSEQQRYRWDPTRSNLLGSVGVALTDEPVLRDPYETQLVEVGPSSVAGAGEGLFTKRKLDAGFVVSFYSGSRVPHSVVDARDWAANANTISLDNDDVIDVPPEWNDTNAYCASLGHKCNHAFPPRNNCRYSRYYHPRFGFIRSITTIREVRPGEELFVDYDYNQVLGDGSLEAPSWRTSNQKI